MADFQDATSVTEKDGTQYHIKLKRGELAKTTLMPGDPKRSKQIAETWDKMELKANYRQYLSYLGEYKKSPISVTSSGIGTPACEIALVELKNIEVENIIRVGSCGALQPEIELGELVISEAAVRLEDTSDHYVMKEYPAVASRKITNALIQACEENNLPYHVGITATSSSFYTGQGRPVPIGGQKYMPSHRTHLYDDLKKAGVLNFEMEASLLFVLGRILKMEVGAVCAVFANREKNEFGTKGVENAIFAANEAALILFES